jgi:hypothetical protein
MAVLTSNKTIDWGLKGVQDHPVETSFIFVSAHWDIAKQSQFASTEEGGPLDTRVSLREVSYLNNDYPFDHSHEQLSLGCDLRETFPNLANSIIDPQNQDGITLLTGRPNRETNGMMTFDAATAT